MQSVDSVFKKVCLSIRLESGLGTKSGRFSLGFWLFGYYLTTSLSKAGMMIVIVKKQLNVSIGLPLVGAQVIMVHIALSLVNYAEYKMKIFQFFPKNKYQYICGYLVLVVYIWIFFVFGLSKRTLTQMYSKILPQFTFGLNKYFFVIFIHIVKLIV